MVHSKNIGMECINKTCGANLDDNETSTFIDFFLRSLQNSSNTPLNSSPNKNSSSNNLDFSRLFSLSSISSHFYEIHKNWLVSVSTENCISSLLMSKIGLTHKTTCTHAPTAIHSSSSSISSLVPHPRTISPRISSTHKNKQYFSTLSNKIIKLIKSRFLIANKNLSFETARKGTYSKFAYFLLIKSDFSSDVELLVTNFCFKLNS